MEEVDFASVKIDLYEIEKNNWKNNILTMPKPRTYCTFKENYETEPFVYRVHNRAHRSLSSQFRCGILPLKIETGRYTYSIRIQIVYFM